VDRLRARLQPLPLAALGALATFPPAMLHFFGGREAQVEGSVHLYGVGATAAVATVAAVALTVAGARRADARTVLLGTAFSVMAALLSVHGLTTPGFLVGRNGVVSFSGAATLPLGGALLVLAAIAPLHRPRLVRPLVALQVVLLLGVLGLGLAGVLLPALVPSVPEPSGTAALLTLAVGLAFYAPLAVRALRTSRLTRRFADVAVVCGIVWLAAALVPSLTLDYKQLGWWLGHAFELVGLCFVGVPVALDLRRASQSRTLTGGVPAADLVIAEEAFFGARVRALTKLLAQRDNYTECHTRRVALLAVQVGEELGLSPERLRVLAVGGLLHDIGKLSVPDAVLRKPGPLTDEEYEEIKRHPVAGDRLLERLGGFSRPVRQLVLSHHERLDGSGYPHGLREGELDLETRILAVCDVYDALISTRVYREAWTHERASNLLREGAGRHFDSRVVDALTRVVAREHARELVAA
jgi:HD-GYP domain-containing protein (c-di-GMP phosphodiesterase class II)